MIACGILGLNIGLTPPKDLTIFVTIVLFVASIFWPIYLLVWACHRFWMVKP
jgi:hypothetical protein